jgi:type IV secretory pathway VirB4 component
VVGPIRFGKTTLVNFIIGHFRKTQRDRVVGIDYLRGEERTAAMLGGAYGAPGDPMSLARLCPFIAIDTVDGRRRAVEWCELVATLNTSEGKVSGDLLGRFTEAVDFLRSSPTWENEACVTLFLQKLTADKPVKDAFRHYAEGGIYGHIFDATPNEMHAWQRDIRIYDTTVLHSLSIRAVFPALVILCADTERQIDGRRMLLVIEEAHIPLKHPWMEPWLITLLRTRRKQHLGIIFVLTDLEGIAETTLRTLKSLCGTVFATQNPNVHARRSAYQFLGFDNAQIEQLVPSRVTTRRHDGMPTLRYQYWQLGEDGVAPFVLDLSPEELETYARGNDRDKARTAAALQHHPEDVPAAIFEAVKLAGAAEAWRSYFDDLPPAIAAQSVPLAFSAPQQEKLSA